MTTIRNSLRPSRTRLAVTALVLAVVVAVAACSGGGASTDGDAAIEIATPGSGERVATSFDVAFDVNIPVGEPDTGRQHIHLHFDDQPEYDIVYEESHTVTDLAPGPHTLVAVIANGDHSETDTRSQPVEVFVGDGLGQPAPGDLTPPTSDDGNGFDY